jgi:hypothetical protein
MARIRHHARPDAKESLERALRNAGLEDRVTFAQIDITDGGSTSSQML